jgi:uncharacterized protein
MANKLIRKIRKLNVATHRDLGYFFSGLIIVYCLSGIALNHVDDWNPDFIIEKKTIRFTGDYSARGISQATISTFNKMVGETKYKVFDIPTADQVKIYYDNASLHLNLSRHEGLYEKISKRPLFYQVNVLHKNSLKGWKWASDIFAFILVLICVTGLFILRGAQGLRGRGKWLLLGGLLPPALALVIHTLT